MKCARCGHPDDKHSPYNMPGGMWRCDVDGCRCVVVGDETDGRDDGILEGTVGQPTEENR